MGERQTKVINIFQLKGGVGKTTLTCMLANEIIWADIQARQKGSDTPIKIEDPIRVMVLDIDTQNSISMIREEEIILLEASSQNDTEIIDQIVSKKPWCKNLYNRYKYFSIKYGWVPFENVIVDVTAESVKSAIAMIESNEYDYVFMDFPGSYDQAYTGELILYSQYLIIPCDLDAEFDVSAALKFVADLGGIDTPFHNLQDVAFVVNKHRINSIRSRRNIDRIEGATGINFFDTKVKYCQYFKSEFLVSVLPKSIELNLNTYTLTPNKSMNSIVDLASEIKLWIQHG